ncbi:kinase-like domain-containing protein [Thelephora terrestris]|uniref:Kinase-like domain-containing protein n=1 Tax=Thelephora terrestris TaxID=56493 RepID=A0A9P6H6B8_9AGAM|nr:kinase-like domain-containing protein [Thelephora terrestris]
MPSPTWLRKRRKLSGLRQESIGLRSSSEASSSQQERRPSGPYPKPGDNLASQYTILQELATGRFSAVYKVIHNETKQVVAVKQIGKREIFNLAQCNSEYVTRYYGSFVVDYKLWIVMEFLEGGSCFELLKAGVFSEAHIAIICRELLLGLDYLHSEGTIHRDVKAANILLSASGRVKLADFGSAVRLTTTLRYELAGNSFLSAPELICQAGYDAKVDIWGLGIAAMEMAQGELPLAEYNLARDLTPKPMAELPMLEGDFSSLFKDFVSLCLTKDPSARPNTKELLQHRFIRSARKTAYLTKLFERYQRLPSTCQAAVRDTTKSTQSERTSDTAKFTASMSTHRNMGKDLVTLQKSDPSDNSAAYGVPAGTVDDAQTTSSDPPLLVGLDASACERLIHRTFSPREVISLIEAIFTSRREIQMVRDLRGDAAQAFIDVVHERVFHHNSGRSVLLLCAEYVAIKSYYRGQCRYHFATTDLMPRCIAAGMPTSGGVNTKVSMLRSRY